MNKIEIQNVINSSGKCQNSTEWKNNSASQDDKQVKHWVVPFFLALIQYNSLLYKLRGSDSKW